uniref:microtubule-associated protein 9 isoform X2 n=1 Tax=Gasterosteus aculeatus aculeatus TaxID=481459 RepID=UPI001A99688D|nr:microtubule-associated protein 9 isoform X2 [Gasterosteus aculeatus aculeatus]
MTNQPFTTLAYTKSPKTTRRTTFQDELQAAVSARANQTKTDRYSYSDDFNDDEDDFFNELLKSRKKKSGSIKAAKSQAKTNNFDISDDEGKQGRTKKVSFLKTQKIASPSESRENEPPDPPAGPPSNHQDSSSSPRSTNISEENVRFDSSDGLSTDPRIARRSSSKSVSYQTSDDSLLDMPLPLPADNIGEGPPCPGEERSSAPEGGCQTPPVSAPDRPRVPSADTNKEPPRPKPRQRTLGLGLRAVDKMAEDAGSPGVSRPQTSPASIALSSDTSSSLAGGEEGSLSKSSLGKSEQSQLNTTADPGSTDGFISDGSKEQERKNSTSLEEFHADPGDRSQRVSAVQQTARESRTSCSRSAQRPHSVCSGEVQSKYLGTLKLLDRKVSEHESEPRAADSLRAAIYQEWLKKKKEKSRDNLQIKKEEEILKEKKQKEEEAKKGDAVASYEAWKDKKAESLKAKAKEKQEAIRKAQRAIEENEEKKQSAKQVFEKWKREHDDLLKEKSRRQREAEKKRCLRKQEKEEERKTDSKSAFSDWREKKTVVLHEKVLTKREESQKKAEEERYLTEERDKMALEMYESWLLRKDLEQKRQREERRIQAILQDDPPPPWSPPNKTIPFGK